MRAKLKPNAQKRFVALHHPRAANTPPYRLPVDRLYAGDLKFEGLDKGFETLADGSVVRQTLRPN